MTYQRTIVQRREESLRSRAVIATALEVGEDVDLRLRRAVHLLRSGCEVGTRLFFFLAANLRLSVVSLRGHSAFGCWSPSSVSPIEGSIRYVTLSYAPPCGQTAERGTIQT